MPSIDEIYGVSVRTPIRMNLDAFAQALNKIDQRDLAAREEVSKINAGLANIKANLNPADYEWFDEFTNNINNQINQEASFGSLANALNKAKELAGIYAQDSGLLARIKANQDYETKRKEIEARANSGDISQVTRDRWLSENPYKFDETTQRLKEYDTPIGSVDFTKLFSNVNALTLAQTTQRDINEYVDENGNLTNEFLSDYSNIITTQEYSQIRTRQALQNNFDTLVKNNPDAYLALMQDYNDTKWQVKQLDEKINNTSNENEKQKLISFRNQLVKNITKNGQYMSASEYLESRSKSVLDNLVINDIKNNISVKSSKKSTNSGNSSANVNLDEELDLNASGQVQSGSVTTVRSDITDNGQNNLMIAEGIINGTW